MRLWTSLSGFAVVTSWAWTADSFPTSQIPLFHSSGAGAPHNITAKLFYELEELSRIVDISYCVGTTGIQKPFLCASRCQDFEGFELVSVRDEQISLNPLLQLTTPCRRGTRDFFSPTLAAISPSLIPRRIRASLLPSAAHTLWRILLSIYPPYLKSTSHTQTTMGKTTHMYRTRTSLRACYHLYGDLRLSKLRSATSAPSMQAS